MSALSVTSRPLQLDAPKTRFSSLGLNRGEDLGGMRYRRFQELEIKHGRIAMLASVHVLVTLAGFKWSGYASSADALASPRKSNGSHRRIGEIRPDMYACSRRHRITF